MTQSDEDQTQHDEVVRFAREHLTSAVLSDTLDGMGLLSQTLPSNLRPLDEDLILCGRARTGDYKDVYHDDASSDPYEMVTALIEGIRPGDVLVLACGRSGRIHPFGEAQAVAASMRQAAGCVTDGLIRDGRQIRGLRLPCFAAGSGTIRLRGRGRLVAIEVPVNCGGVWISPGDLVFGDVDGVIVVPRRMEQQVLADALAKAEREREIVRELRRGASIVELYRKYRTL